MALVTTKWVNPIQHTCNVFFVVVACFVLLFKPIARGCVKTHLAVMVE